MKPDLLFFRLPLSALAGQNTREALFFLLTIASRPVYITAKRPNMSEK
jgi:hypothetical protein